MRRALVRIAGRDETGAGACRPKPPEKWFLSSDRITLEDGL